MVVPLLAVTVTDTVSVIAVPLVGVTVRVYVVVVAGLTLTGVPLVTGILPGVITPVPLVNTPVRFVLDPAVIVDGLAVKLVMVGVEVDVDACVTKRHIPPIILLEYRMLLLLSKSRAHPPLVIAAGMAADMAAIESGDESGAEK